MVVTKLYLPVKEKKREKRKILLTYTSQNEQNIVGVCSEYQTLLSLANPWTQMEFQEINKENV